MNSILDNIKLGVRLGRMLRPEVTEQAVQDLMTDLETVINSKLEFDIKTPWGPDKIVASPTIINNDKFKEETGFEHGSKFREDYPEEEEENRIKPIKYRDQTGKIVKLVEFESYKFDTISREEREDFILIDVKIQYPSTKPVEILHRPGTPPWTPKKEKLSNDIEDEFENEGMDINDTDLSDFIIDDKNHKRYGEKYYDPYKDSHQGALTGGESIITEYEALQSGRKLRPLKEDSAPLGEKKRKGKTKKEKKPKGKRLSIDKSKQIFTDIVGWLNGLPKETILEKRLINKTFPEVDAKKIEMIKWALNSSGFIQNTGIGYFKVINIIPTDLTYMGCMDIIEQKKKDKANETGNSESNNTQQELNG